MAQSRRRVRRPAGDRVAHVRRHGAAALLGVADNARGAASAHLLAARAGGVPMELTEVFEDDFARMPVMNMAWGALLEGGVAGTVLAAGCRRWARRPRVVFVALAIAGLVASFALPIASDASTATKVVLSISHVVVAAIIVPALALALPASASPQQEQPAHGADS